MRGSRGPKPAMHGGAPQRVRIIGGQWKRTLLPVVDGQGLRPTPDRVRETVFNWLNHLFDGRWNARQCLDLFAGTGALGFEAASRGAQRVLMIENHSPAVRHLLSSKEKLAAAQVEVRRMDAMAALRELAQAQARFDLIFLDPPYQQEWLVKILPECERLLTSDGLVYAEAEFPLDGQADAPWLAGWELVRTDRAGSVHYHLLRRNSPPGIGA